MVRKILVLLPLFLVSFACLPQGVGNGSYTFLADTTIETMVLNCSTQDCEAFFNNAILFKKVKTLKLTGNTNKLDYNAFAFLPSLESLEINGLYTYDWKKIKTAKLGKALKSCGNLNHLELSYCGVKTVPPSFSKLKKLRYIKLSNNRKKLKQATLYKRLSRITTLDSLDISHNDLGKRSLNKKINSFAELDYLNVEGTHNGWGLGYSRRLIRGKLKMNLSVKSLRLSNYDIYNHLFYSKLVPENRLYADYDAMTNNEYSVIFGKAGSWRLNWEPDTLQYRVHETEGGDKAAGDKRFYGEFNTRNVDVKALSTAYLHYPEFQNENYSSDKVDSTKFGERYNDLRYTGTSISGFQLKVFKSLPAHFMSKAKYEKLEQEYACPFNLIPEKKGGNTYIASFSGFTNTYLLTEYPELNAFAGTKFVYVESGNGSPFNRCFRDLRIAYDEGTDLFNLELKSQEGFETFHFRLMRGDSANTAENSQRIYTKYRDVLQRKEEKFDSRLQAEAKNHQQKAENAQRTAWKKLKKDYMSKAEKAMTRPEWENYCLAVTENEKDALYNSELSAALFKRTMEVKGFTELDPYQWYKRVEELSGVTCTFEDINNSPLTAKKIIIIDKQHGVFTALNGAEENYGCNLFFPSTAGKQYDLFVEFDKGSYSIVRNLEFTGEATFRNVLFRVEFLPPQLSDIQLVMRKLNY